MRSRYHTDPVTASGAKRTVGKARMRDGSRFKVDQTNNSYIFPGVGLGALAVGARRVSDGMFMAAAKALANSSQRPWRRSGAATP